MFDAADEEAQRQGSPQLAVGALGKLGLLENNFRERERKRFPVLKILNERVSERKARCQNDSGL